MWRGRAALTLPQPLQARLRSTLSLHDPLWIFQVAVVAAAQIREVAEIRADLFRHGAQQADMQRLRHGFVNLAQP